MTNAAMSVAVPALKSSTMFVRFEMRSALVFLDRTHERLGACHARNSILLTFPLTSLGSDGTKVTLRGFL